MSGPMSPQQECQADLLTAWQEEHGTYLLPDELAALDLFECRGLDSCHALIEWRGVCPSCQAIATDAASDAASEMDHYEMFHGDES